MYICYFVPVRNMSKSFNILDPSKPPNTYKFLAITTNVCAHLVEGNDPLALGRVHTEAINKIKWGCISLKEWCVL